MSGHTEGRISFAPGAGLLLLGDEIIAFARDPRRGDAHRRLVAAWNFCEGVPTELLVADGSIEKVANVALERETERDELIEALRKMVDRYHDDPTARDAWKVAEDAKELLAKYPKVPA